MDDLAVSLSDDDYHSLWPTTGLYDGGYKSTNVRQSTNLLFLCFGLYESTHLHHLPIA